VVKELGNTHAAVFDLPRVLESFLDAVSEMLKPSRAGLLLPTEGTGSFSIVAQRGLPLHLVKSVRLTVDNGLPHWLEAHGRVIQAAEAEAQAAQSLARDAARDLAMLKGTVAVPLLAHGELVAILTLGRRVAGHAYSMQDLETLFEFGSHVATNIRDIQIQQRLEYQRVYIEQILSHMSSGLITIDRDERVSIMNRRAEQTLGLAADAILNRALRVLPSPLGDLLYESLRTSRRSERVEIQLGHPKLPLEVSTYPLLGSDATPLGAVMMFEDLSTSKRIAAERRQHELFELLTRVISRMADEIKGPLVSVRTFMALVEEKVDEEEFRQRCAAVAGRNIGRLLDIVEKISTLVSDREFRFEGIDARKIIEECLAELGAQDGAEASDGKRLLHFTDWEPSKRASVSIHFEGDAFTVKGDRGQLKRAVTYLLWYLMRKSSGDEPQLSISLATLPGGASSLQLLVSSRSAELEPHELQQIFDPLKAVEQSLIDVGPFISQRIIETHGGRLQASRARREVSFAAELPLLT
jgi:nitrogen fixation/metabolism regulation signal transduction histidine kinase